MCVLYVFFVVPFFLWGSLKHHHKKGLKIMVKRLTCFCDVDNREHSSQTHANPVLIWSKSLSKIPPRVSSAIFSPETSFVLDRSMATQTPRLTDGNKSSESFVSCRKKRDRPFVLGCVNFQRIRDFSLTKFRCHFCHLRKNCRKY